MTVCPLPEGHPEQGEEGIPTGASEVLPDQIIMANRRNPSRNDYRCSMERNQNGKYCVRVQVFYPRHAWSVGVYFLASSFDRSMKKLQQALDFLQRNEEKLWLWGVERGEEGGFSAELLKEAGLRLDRRGEFPRKASSISLPLGKDVPAFALGTVRRGLAESVESDAALSARA